VKIREQDHDPLDQRQVAVDHRVDGHVAQGPRRRRAAR
jgi:hypothetical protein